MVRRSYTWPLCWTYPFRSFVASLVVLAAVVADIVIGFRMCSVLFVAAAVVAGHTGSRCAVAVAAAGSMGLLAAFVFAVVAMAVAGHRNSTAAPAVVAAG